MTDRATKIADFTARQALTGFAKQRLEELRESLEAINLDQRLSDYYRGQIAMLKEIQETFIE